MSWFDGNTASPVACGKDTSSFICEMTFSARATILGSPRDEHINLCSDDLCLLGDDSAERAVRSGCISFFFSGDSGNGCHTLFGAVAGEDSCRD